MLTVKFPSLHTLKISSPLFECNAPPAKNLLIATWLCMSGSSAECTIPVKLDVLIKEESGHLAYWLTGWLTEVLAVFQADPPKPEKIPEEDLIGVTVLLLTCSYLGQEFLRVGYYVSNDYIDEQLREEPPAEVQIDKVQRNILAENPRVTKFPIVFNPQPPPSSLPPPPSLESNGPVALGQQ